jgi:hypothetical protein
MTVGPVFALRRPGGRAAGAAAPHALLPLLLVLLALAALLAPLRPARAAERQYERVQVTDPFVEMRTGPGRGYPVHHVAARAEWIEIRLRFTDWFKVRTANGREGWVHRAQLENTLTEAGAAKTFRDILVDDYLRRRLELGAAYGRFKGEPMLKVWTAYRLSESINVEAGVGQVQGVFSGTDFWQAGLNLEPWSDRRLSPFFGIGVGRFKNIPNASLVGAAVTDAKLGHAAIGLRFYLTDRFVARVDYSIYTAFIGDARSDEYRAATAGLSFFF